MNYLSFLMYIKGEMSVVGPRPHAIPYQDMYGQIFEEIKLRHNVKPGTYRLGTG